MLTSEQIQRNSLSMEVRPKAKGQALGIDSIINSINRLSFSQRPISFIFKRVDQEQTISRDAIPQPCMGNQLTCAWLDDGIDFNQLKADELHHLHINYNNKLIVAIPKLNCMDNESIRITLPATGTELNSRKIMRHLCDHITLRIEQNGTAFTGELLDFHAEAFSAAIDGKQRYAQSCLITDTVWKTTLTAPKDIIYSGACRIAPKDFYHEKPIIVLSPVQSNIPVQKPKKYRSERVKPVPSLHISFQHPLTGKVVILDVSEISGSGFAVNEDEQKTVLLPGMLIPSLELRLSNIFSINCSARVVHRTLSADQHANNSIFVCGIVFTDMDMGDHTKLVAFLQQAKDQRTLLCNSTNMDALWDFFFDTGFIYPKKYAFFHEDRRAIKKTLEKLYHNPQNVSRHFIFQDKGVINGLIALQRVYKYTWMMHHFAARADARIAGPKVLSQIGSYINDSYYLEANRMQYAIIYYRPENKFPNQVFGGVARSVKNPKICSLDSFAYFHVQKSVKKQLSLPDAYHLSETTQADLAFLKTFYERISGGLMLNAFDLAPEMTYDNELSVEYGKAGLKYDRIIFTLKRDDLPIAIIMIHRSNIGINLSDLTNCMHVFVLDPEALSKKTLVSALSHLAHKFTQQWITVNLFPADYADRHSLKYEKSYTLWTYEMRYSDHYYGYLKRLSRFFKH